jgi:acyl carrier protein
MTARLGRAELARMQRRGVAPLPIADGLALLDAALADGEPVLVPVRVVPSRREPAHDLPRILRDLARPAAVAASPSSLLERLAALPPGERRGALAHLVQDEVAAVLGLRSAASVPADRPIKELGLDSLQALDVRKRLMAQLGIKLGLNHLLGPASAAELGDLLVEQLAAHGAIAAASPTQSHGEWEEFRL